MPFAIGIDVYPKKVLTPNTNRIEIVDGDVAPINRYSWLTHVGDNKDSKWYKECSGALIAPRYVLISYECHLKIDFYGSSHVTVGKFCEDADNCGQSFEVLEIEDIISHPSTMHNNIDAHLSLIKLFSPSSINPVQLDVKNMFFNEADSLWMAGFGVNALQPGSFFGTQPSILQHAELNIMDSTEECLYAIEAGRDDDYDVMNDRQTEFFCTNSSISFPCYGDAGNPIYDAKNDVLQGIAVGPVNNCGRTKLPMIHMRVASFVSLSRRLLLKIFGFLALPNC